MGSSMNDVKCHTPVCGGGEGNSEFCEDVMRAMGLNK